MPGSAREWVLACSLAGILLTPFAALVWRKLSEVRTTRNEAAELVARWASSEKACLIRIEGRNDRELELTIERQGGNRAEGSCPIAHHHRVLPLSGETFAMTGEELDAYIASWDDDPQIRSFLMARRRAEQHLVLFIEHLPFKMADWLPGNLDQLAMVTAGIQQTLEFLHRRGVGHFDAHLGNIMTDGHQVFLTDFGLAIDETFELDDEEFTFFRSHRHYDAGEFAECVNTNETVAGFILSSDHADR